MKKRARIEDVVRLSGVSRSTVDRVLNERSGVRQVTLEKVERAMRELGYSPNSLSRRAANPLRQIEVLLSAGTNPFFDQIRAGMQAAVDREQRLGTSFLFRKFDPYDLSTMSACLNSVDQKTSAVIVLGADDMQIAHDIDALIHRGLRVVTLISDAPQSKRSAYVGQNNFAAGRTAGRMMAEIVPDGEGEVALLIGHLQYRHLLDRQSGFRQTLAKMRTDLTIYQTQPYGQNPETARSIIEDVLQRTPAVKGIYIAGGGQPGIMRALHTTNLRDCTVIGHEVNQMTRAALREGVFKMLVAHDVYEVGRNAVHAALGLDTRPTIYCGINIYVSENIPSD